MCEVLFFTIWLQFMLSTILPLNFEFVVGTHLELNLRVRTGRVRRNVDGLANVLWVGTTL